MVKTKQPAAPVVSQDASSEPEVLAFKGFDKNLKCRDFQYEIGKTFEHKGRVAACSSGFHACENPFDVWGYYNVAESRFALVKMGGKLSRHGDDSKIASARITIEAELKLPEFIKRCVDYIMALVKDVPATLTGADVVADAGTSAQIGSSGYGARIGSSGYGARIGSSGYGARIGSSGDGARIGSSGDGARIGSSGYGARIGSSGDGAQIGSSGDGARIGSSGDGARIEAAGKDSVVAASGSVHVFTLGESGCIALPYHDGERVRFTTVYVGENGIEASIAYALDAAGAVVRA